MKTWSISIGYGYDNDIDHKDSMTLNLPNQFKKKDVEALVISNYSNYRTVSVKVACQKQKKFNWHELTEDENTAICLANIDEW
jgi:hypothetical protein